MAKLKMNWDWCYEPRVRIIVFTEFLFQCPGGSRFKVNVCLGENVTPSSRRFLTLERTAVSHEKAALMGIEYAKGLLQKDGIPDWVTL
jgi:hypothetical protein